MTTSRRIYLDNAATSFPKPESVYDAVDHYNRNVGAAVGRSAYSHSVEVQRTITRCRTRAAELLGAESVYELERCWENIQRTWQAEAHVRTILFREETRWPGYYFRADKPKMDEQNWKCFANITWNPATGEWTTLKRDIIKIVD